MSEEEIGRAKRGKACVEECFQCQEEYKTRNPFDTTLSGLRAKCWTCSNAHKNKAADPKKDRGRVGGYQPW